MTHINVKLLGAWCRLVKWLHDSLIFLALFVLFAAFGGLRLLGYSYECSVVPYEAVPEGYSVDVPKRK